MEKPANDSFIEVQNLKKWFPVRAGLFTARSKTGEQRVVKAVDGVNMKLERGQVVGIVGGSGAGKTVLAMTMLRLYEPTAGSVFFDGRDITAVPNKELKYFRRQSQLIFQDPYGSLNPRFTVERTIIEPLIVHKIGTRKEQKERVIQALELVDLVPPETFLPRFPHQLSGGQRQRLCIARAMVMDVKLLIADEPVSMLDVSIRAGILSLLNSLVRDFKLTVLYVSHDIACMRYVCDFIYIMYRGHIVESGPTEVVINRPIHPYTKALIAAVPEMDVGVDRERVDVKGESLMAMESIDGCQFRLLCPYAKESCAANQPELVELEAEHHAACFSATLNL